MSRINSSVCWFPDGQTDGASGSMKFVPTNPYAQNSVCCSIGDGSMKAPAGGELCLSGNGLLYRGGCTDRTFKDAACPTYCVDSSGLNGGAQNGFQFLKTCGNTGADSALQWICDVNGNCSDSTLRFNMEMNGTSTVNITGTIDDTANPSSTASVCTSSTAVSLSSSNSNCTSMTRPSATVVGAGVGVPLGIVALASIVWALFERREKKTMMGSRRDSMEGMAMVHKQLQHHEFPERHSTSPAHPPVNVLQEQYSQAPKQENQVPANHAQELSSYGQREELGS